MSAGMLHTLWSERTPLDEFAASCTAALAEETDKMIMQGSEQTRRALTCVYANGVCFSFNVLSVAPDGEDPSDLIQWSIIFEDGATRELLMNAQEAVDVIAGLAKCMQIVIENASPLCTDPADEYEE